MADLEETRRAALAAEAFANAIRCSELQGRAIGLWKNEGRTDGSPQDRTLDQMIAGVARVDEEEPTP
jgi:hypothetical protein